GWPMVGVGVILLVAILIFIMQNGQRVRVRFLYGGRHAPAWGGVVVRRPAWRAAGAGGGRGPGAAAAGGRTAPSSHRPGAVVVNPRPLAMTTESHAFGNPTRG